MLGRGGVWRREEVGCGEGRMSTRTSQYYNYEYYYKSWPKAFPTVKHLFKCLTEKRLKIKSIKSG